MKILINEEGQFVLKEVYEPVILITEEGNQLAVAMRDDTIEMKVLGKPDAVHNKTFRANMQTGDINNMEDGSNCSANLYMKNGKLINILVGDLGIDIKSDELGTIRLSPDFKQITQLEPTGSDPYN